MIQLTEEAQNFFHKQSLFFHKKYCSISLKKVGCSGYQYIIAWIDASLWTEIPYETWVLCTDPAWQSLLDTLTIDITEDDLGQKKLTFTNPQTSAWCGCGDSFMVPDAQS